MIRRTLSLVVATVLAGGCPLAQAGQVLPEQRLVWAHAMITFPLDLDVLKPCIPEGYEGQYVSYPLDVRRNYAPGLPHRADVQSGKNAGLDGFSVDIFSDGMAADGNLTAAGALGDFHIVDSQDHLPWGGISSGSTGPQPAFPSGGSIGPAIRVQRHGLRLAGQ